MSDDYTTEVIENNEYGELWPDGTFKKLSSYKASARSDFEKTMTYDLRPVPESLRPVFAVRRVVTTIDTYMPEPVDEP